MTELFIMNEHFELLRVCDDYNSLSWCPRWTGVGEFQLDCPISYLEDLLRGKYIGRNDSRETVLIDYDSLLKDEIGGKSVLVKGKFLKQILDDRVVYQAMNFNNKTVEDVVLELIEEHFVNNRSFDKLAVKRTGEASTKITTQITGGSVLERIVKIEEEQKVSCNVEYDPIEDKIYCFVSVGKNHSQTQDENSWVVFSEELENVYDYEYTKIRQTKNFAYVAGAGEGQNRIIKTVDIRKPGDALKELYVDARDLQETDENGSPIPRDRYLKLLEQRGNEKLSEYAEIQEIEAKVIAGGILQYNQDYKLGDIVDFVDNSKGIDAMLRIVGVNEDIENGERKLELVFGKERLNLKEIIKREVGK